MQYEKLLYICVSLLKKVCNLTVWYDNVGIGFTRIGYIHIYI